MERFLDPLLTFARTAGGPGLFLVAFLDSSFLSLPEINDLLIIWMVARNEALMPYYASMATLGSVAGCLLLYALGRRGGEAVLRKRFHARHIDRAMALFQRYGALAVIVPALLPPPAPFKLFVLAAGVAGVRPVSFVLAIALARGIRYLVLGTLAVYYGDAALDLMRTYGREVALWAVAIIVLATLSWWAWSRRRPREVPS